MYGKCVAATTTGTQELRKDLCAKEFEALKICFTNAVSARSATVTLKVLFNVIHLPIYIFDFITGQKKSQMNGNHPGLSGPISRRPS